MSNKLILRLSNEIGNQMFMYASSLGISKKLNRSLLIDDETAYLLKKNISKYGLNNFTITSEIAPNNYKFLGVSGYIKRKVLKKIDIFRTNKNFLIEKVSAVSLAKKYGTPVYCYSYKRLKTKNNISSHQHYRINRSYEIIGKGKRNFFQNGIRRGPFKCS